MSSFLKYRGRGVAAQVIDSLQHHANRDAVELAADTGFDLATLEPALDALVSGGHVLVHESDGERVFELARDFNYRSLAALLSA
jgi:hypothetical protein